MKLAALVVVVLAVGVVGACGSVHSGGTDAGGGNGGSNGGSQARGGSGGTNAGRGGTTGVGGCVTSCAGTSGAGRGGAGGANGGSGGVGGGRVPCETDANCQGFKCCAGVCVNAGNDILNCGTCSTVCTGAHPYCNGGTCQDGWPCSLVPAACNPGGTCCGSSCCTGTQICCAVMQGPTYIGCVEPVNGSCPTGCAACVCAAPKTPIATPAGDRPIADLKVGDLVYSIDHGVLAVVPIQLVHRQPVTGSHRVVELRLAHGVTLRISPRHPTADGRHLADLVAGDLVDGVRVISARLVDYDQPFTYDILPASDSGTYFAGGALIGSTLATPPRDTATSAPASPSLRRASVASSAR